MEANALPNSRSPNPDAAAIRETIRGFLSTLLERDPDELDAGVSLLQLGAQSLHFIVLTSHLEKLYPIEVPREYAIPDDYTIDDFVAIVERELRGAAARADIL